MSQEVVQSVAGDSKQSVEQSNMSIGDYAAFRLGVVEKAKANKPAPEKPAPVESASEVEEEEKETATPKEGAEVPADSEAKGKEVLSQVDLSELSDEDIQELAQKGKSGLLKRIAELTAKRKLAEEKAAQLEAYMASQAKKAPEPKVENNPFAKVQDIKELDQKAQEMAEVVEWAEEVLFQASDLAATDVAVTVDGKEYTKADVRMHLANARKARDKFIPAQKRELENAFRRITVRKALEQQAAQELEWLASKEDNDAKVHLKRMLSDERIAEVEKVAPDLAAVLPYYLAHAANSIYARKTIPIEGKTSPKLAPPSTSPSSEAAAPSRQDAKSVKATQELSKRLAETGSIDDFVALRTAKLSKR